MQIQTDLQTNHPPATLSDAVIWPYADEVVVLPTIIERPKTLKTISAPFQWRHKWNSFMNGVIGGAVSLRYD